jgi:hypothetical protein
VVGEDPVAIMVAHISERLMRNPAIIPVIVHPSAHGERGPSWGDIKGTPEIAIVIVIIDSRPGAVFLQLPGMIVQVWRKIFHRVSPRAQPARPQIIPLGIPFIPVGIWCPLAGGDLLAVREDGGRARHHFVLLGAAGMHIIDLAFQGDHFHGLIAYV